MPKGKTVQYYFVIGVLITALSIIAGLFVWLIFIAPSALVFMAGLPVWPLLIIAIPVGFIILGWVVITIGGFRRR